MKTIIRSRYKFGGNWQSCLGSGDTAYVRSWAMSKDLYIYKSKIGSWRNTYIYWDEGESEDARRGPHEYNKGK